MRLPILAIFLCAGVVGLCQSADSAPRASAPADQRHPGTQHHADCNQASADPSALSLAPQQAERRFEAPAWNWDGAQLDSKSAPRSPFSLPTPKPCPFLAANGEPAFESGLNSQWFQARLEPIPAPWPNAKAEPIPTTWPNAKLEPIPNVWPNLKLVLIADRPAEPSAKSTPAK